MITVVLSQKKNTLFRKNHHDHVHHVHIQAYGLELGLERVKRRGEHDRLESERLGFHRRVRQGYLELMEREPERWLRLDGAPDPGARVAR